METEPGGLLPFPRTGGVLNAQASVAHSTFGVRYSPDAPYDWSAPRATKRSSAVPRKWMKSLQKACLL